MNRRELLGALAAAPLLKVRILSASPRGASLTGVAGVDRVVVLPGKTYLRGRVDYGSDSSAPTTQWTKVSGPGSVTFADPAALTTTATFSAIGTYVLALTASLGTGDTAERASATVTVKAEAAPPAVQLDPLPPMRFAFQSPLWSERAKVLITQWIPHCLDRLTDPSVSAGGLDNFIEAGKKLRGEAHGQHKGFVFSNAYVFNALEAMSVALVVDAQGDAEILASQERFRRTLDEWIPIVIGAQEPDGYLQTAFTLPRISNAGGDQTPGPFYRWERRHDHEGYTGGYLIEAGIAHHMATDRRDTRLYDAGRRLADCWYDNIGPAPKKAWYDGHQEMEQALVRLGRYVNQTEGAGKGQKYIDLGKFLLDCRYTAARDPRERSEYDQSHLPVVEQYEAVGHAVRAVYNYSAMADVAAETHDVDYQSAVKSLWENIVHRKYYVTGGVGSGETSEGFGPNYSLRHNAYCESCSSCGEVFFQHKLNLAYHDADYVSLYEQTIYNALLGAVSFDGKTFFYPNPLDGRGLRTAWHSVPCCVANIPRTLLAMPTWMYAKGTDGLYVNLFVGSDVTLDDVAGTRVQLRQRTNYPWDGKVTLTVTPSVASAFTIRVRVPKHDVSALYTSTPSADGFVSFAVNGRAVEPQIENGYAVVTRTWRRGDRIEFEVPMRVQRVYARERVAATRGQVALRYGPLIYNIEQVDVGEVTKAIAPDAPLKAEWRGDLLGGMMVITGQFADGSPLLAIPNYARMNRGPEPVAAAAGQPPAPAPVISKVWVREA